MLYKKIKKKKNEFVKSIKYDSYIHLLRDFFYKKIPI